VRQQLQLSFWVDACALSWLRLSLRTQRAGIFCRLLRERRREAQWSNLKVLELEYITRHAEAVMRDRELLPSQRIALAGWLLASGQSFTVNELAERIGGSSHGTYQMLIRVSSVLPIAQLETDENGAHIWGRCFPD